MRKVLVLALAATFIVAGCQKQEVATATTETTVTTETMATTAMETTATVAQSTGVAECDAYLAALEKYMQCDKVPQAVRDAQAQSAQQMRTSWATWASLPEESRKVAQDAAKTSCTTALATLRTGATASGCPIE
jgi:hypothetical protein